MKKIKYNISNNQITQNKYSFFEKKNIKINLSIIILLFCSIFISLGLYYYKLTKNSIELSMKQKIIDQTINYLNDTQEMNMEFVSYSYDKIYNLDKIVLKNENRYFAFYILPKTKSIIYSNKITDYHE